MGMQERRPTKTAIWWFGTCLLPNRPAGCGSFFLAEFNLGPELFKRAGVEHHTVCDSAKYAENR